MTISHGLADGDNVWHHSCWQKPHIHNRRKEKQAMDNEPSCGAGVVPPGGWVRALSTT